MPQDKRYFKAKGRAVFDVELQLFGADEDEKTRSSRYKETARARKRDEKVAQKPLGGLTFDDFDRLEP